MLGYKFLHSEHIDQMFGGSFLFRRLRYYRLLEAATKNQWIGDSREGIEITRINDLEIKPGHEHAKNRSSLAERGIAIPPEARVHFVNSIVANETNCFVFCFSLGELDNLRREFS